MNGNGAASTPAIYGSDTIFSGGSTTTTKPYVLFEPTGTTSTGWSTFGTLLGLNVPSGFAGNLADFQLNGTSRFSVSNSGNVDLARNLFLIAENSVLKAPSSGVITLLNSAQTGFSRIQLGGTISSFGGLQTNGTETDSELADGSGLAPFAASVFRTKGYTVSTLPAGVVGMTAYVIDATSCTFLGTLTGGGSAYCPVTYNGTAWVGH